MGKSMLESLKGLGWVHRPVVAVALALAAIPAQARDGWRWGEAVAQAEGEAENGINRLSALDIQASDGEVVIRVTGDTAPVWRHFTLLDPLQLAVDIGNSDGASLSESYSADSGLISKIQVSRLEALETTRVGIFLAQEIDSSLSAEGDTLVIRLRPLGAAATAPTEEPLAEEPVAPEPARPAEVPAAPTSPARAIRDIRVESQDGGALLYIDTDGQPGNFNSFSLESPDRIVLDLWNIDSALDSANVAVDKAGVQKVRVGKHADKVRLVIDMTSAQSFTAGKVGSSIVVALGSATLPEEGAAVASTGLETAPTVQPTGNLEEAAEPIEEIPQEPAAETAPAAPDEAAPAPADEAAPAVETAPASSEEPTAEPLNPEDIPAGADEAPAEAPTGGEESEQVVIDTPSKKYKGQKRLSLDFKDADINNVLRIIAEVSGLNVIAGDEVKGTVTIKLKDVPWEEALDVILRSKGLGRESIGDIIRIAKNETLDKEAGERLAKQQQLEQSIPLVTRIIPVNYASAKELQPQIEPLLSGRGEVRVDDRTNNIIVKDIPENVVKAESMIRSLDLQTPQVLIASKIVEARNNLNKSLGVQWGGAGLLDAAHGTGTNMPFPNRVGIFGTSTIESGNNGQSGATNYLVDLPAAVGTGSGGAIGFTFGHISNAINLNLRLSALEATGDIEVISSPRVTTLDNREAKIKQGFSLPFTTVSARGTQTQFIDAVLELQVTPHVTANKSVIMRINVKKDAPSTEFVGSRGEPSIAKKEANTEVLVRDGETTVIGGIFDSEHSINKRGIPWFSSIPLLGWLFRQEDTKSSRNELLIFITPTVISES